MKVIFLQDILNQAQAGDIKEVKNGYARNYLIPKKLAARATPDQLQRLQGIKRIAEEKRLKESGDAQTLARAITGSTVTLVARVANTGRLYGSVTVVQIAEELSRLLGRPIERRMMVMEEPIREPGEYQIETRLGLGVTASFTVIVNSQDQPNVRVDEKVIGAQPAEAVEKKIIETIADRPAEAINEEAIETVKDPSVQEQSEEES